MYITKHDTDNMSYTTPVITVETKLSLQYHIFKFYNC